jgi:hypothetical protein
MGSSPLDLGTKNHFAGEGQQQLSSVSTDGTQVVLLAGAKDNKRPPLEFQLTNEIKSDSEIY